MPAVIKPIKKKVPVPTPKPPRHARPKHAMNTEKTTGDPRGVGRKKAGGSMKKKGYAMGGAMKKKGMSKGGKLKMVEKDGKKVPFFAADGKGKMAGGGMMKKKGYAKGGSVDPKKLMNPTKYKIKSGDTLSQIAKKYGTSVKAIMAANPKIKNANSIRAGAGLTIPGGVKSKTSNPYKGQTSKEITTGKMAPSKPKRKLPSMRQAKPSGGLFSKKPADKSKDPYKTATPTRPAAKKAPPKKTVAKPTPKPGFGARLLDAVKPNRPGSAKMAAGGKMKKKGYKKGGTVRGAGAATRGKRFGRSA